MVGHVTKDGQIAGPRVLEHSRYCGLFWRYLGDQFRILRAIKTVGPAHEIGVFEMREEGLAEVQNPLALFLEARDESVPGAAVFAGIEGTRLVLVEIQALAALIAGDAAARDCRLGQRAPSMVLAVLEARCGMAFGGCATRFLNVAGGLRINEPAAIWPWRRLGLRQCQASYPASPCPAKSVVSAVRPVSQSDLTEGAAKLGFQQACSGGQSGHAGQGNRDWPPYSRAGVHQTNRQTRID